MYGRLHSEVSGPFLFSGLHVHQCLHLIIIQSTLIDVDIIHVALEVLSTGVFSSNVHGTLAVLKGTSDWEGISLHSIQVHVECRAIINHSNMLPDSVVNLNIIDGCHGADTISVHTNTAGLTSSGVQAKAWGANTVTIVQKATHVVSATFTLEPHGHRPGGHGLVSKPVVDEADMEAAGTIEVGHGSTLGIRGKNNRGLRGLLGYSQVAGVVVEVLLEGEVQKYITVTDNVTGDGHAGADIHIKLHVVTTEHFNTTVQEVLRVARHHLQAASWGNSWWWCGSCDRRSGFEAVFSLLEGRGDTSHPRLAPCQAWGAALLVCEVSVGIAYWDSLALVEALAVGWVRQVHYNTIRTIVTG